MTKVADMATTITHGAVQVARLRPDDVLVVQVDERLRAEDCEAIRAKMVEVFGADRKVLVLSNGARLTVLGVAEGPPNAGGETWDACETVEDGRE